MDNSEAEDESVKDLNDITSELIDKKMYNMKRNVFFVSVNFFGGFLIFNLFFFTLSIFFFQVESKEPEGIVLTPQSYIPGNDCFQVFFKVILCR